MRNVGPTRVRALAVITQTVFNISKKVVYRGHRHPRH
jgi:hypothetical protein